MASLTKVGMVFNVEDLSHEELIELHPDRAHLSKPECIIVGYNSGRQEPVINFTLWKPSFERPEKLIWLSSDNYLQFQMIRHLDWQSILNYFEPLDLFED